MINNPKDLRGKDNNNSSNGNGNSNSNNIVALKRTINILLFVLLSFLLLSAYLVRTSFGIANKNIEIQKVITHSLSYHHSYYYHC